MINIIYFILQIRGEIELEKKIFFCLYVIPIFIYVVVFLFFIYLRLIF